MVLRARPISLWLAAAMVVTPRFALAQASTAPSASAPAPQPVSAQAAIAAGDKATRGRDFAGALAQYQAAQQATPSWRAEMGVADALYNLGRLGEAYDTYADVKQTYPKLGAVERGLVAKRLKELGPKTGYLSVHASEPGAEVDVDGKSLGPSPVALVRVTTGTHDVRVTKDGFSPFEGKAEVAPDGKALVDATLAAMPTQGHVVVHASGPAPLRVLVDGVDVGATPWEGDLPAGAHTIAGRSSTESADAQSVNVAVGSRSEVDLAAAGISGHVQVTTSDGKGLIYLDGVVKGEGTYSGDVAPGPHTVVVSRDGYQRYEKTIPIAERQTWAETVTLSPVVAPGAGPGEAAERPFQGLYGGFGLAGLFGVGGMGTSLETDCSTLGAASCDTPNATGGGAFGYVGYTWDPVGFEVVLAGMVDDETQNANFSATSQSSSSLLPAATPARTEAFQFLRMGGLAAVRARVSFQTRLVRGTLSAGPGVSYRLLQMERTSTANDGSGRTDRYVPDPVSYVSPAIAADGAISLRISPTTAVSLGIFFWADSASIAGSNSAPPVQGHGLFNPSNPKAGFVPIPTPGYNLATGPQVVLGPYIGMQFGP